MTDYSLVKAELMRALQCDAAQLEEYEPYINNAVACVAPILKNPDDENDMRIVRLCAMKAYVQIALTDNSDCGVTSFKAGDVSYTMDTFSAERAESLLASAMRDCRDLLKNSKFSFKAV